MLAPTSWFLLYLRLFEILKACEITIVIRQARSMLRSSSTTGYSGSLVLLFLIVALGWFQHWVVCALQDGSHKPSPEPINQTICKPRATPLWLQDPSKAARILSGPPCFVVEASGPRKSLTACFALSFSYFGLDCMPALLFTSLLFNLRALLVACMLDSLARQTRQSCLGRPCFC